MEVVKTSIDGVLLFKPRVFGDDRGFFLETYNQDRYQQAGLKETFVQDNISFSSRGVLRGLHLQNPNAQGKLVQVLHGEVFDVAVDLRFGSPTFGKWEGVFLNAENKHQFYVPPGFGHGFVVTSDTALFSYKCTDLYNQSAEFGVLWNDPDIGIKWPVDSPQLSEKDASAPRLKEIDTERFVKFQ